MNQLATILDKSAYFEHRGPSQASLTEVNGHNVYVHRNETDWSDVVQGKEVVDNRCSELADLYPRPRDVLHGFMRRIEREADLAEVSTLKPPSMK